MLTNFFKEVFTDTKKGLVVFSRGRFVLRSDGTVAYYDNDGATVSALAEVYDSILVVGRIVRFGDEEFESASQYQHVFHENNVRCVYYRHSDNRIKKFLYFVRVYTLMVRSYGVIIFGPSFSAITMCIFLGLKRRVVFYSGLDWPPSRKYIGRVLERTAVRSVKAVLCTGGYLEQKYQAYGAGVLVEQVRPTLKAFDSECAETLKPKGKFLEVISVGAISKRKNQELLIDALLLLREKGVTNIKVRFCGLGDLGDLLDRRRDDLERLGDQVDFLGHVKSSGALINLYRNSHLLCICSNDEGVPRVLYEGIQCGLCVLTTPLPGVEHFMGKDAIYFPFSDADALATQLQHLNQNHGVIETLGRLGRIKYENFFDRSTSEMFVTALDR